MTVTPTGVAGMGAYKGAGASRPMAACRGESGTRVGAMMASRKVQAWGRRKGETVKVSSMMGGGG